MSDTNDTDSEKLVLEAESNPCPICQVFMTTTHYENGASVDNCPSCLFEGIRLSGSRYNELIKSVETNQEKWELQQVTRSQYVARRKHHLE